MSEHKTKEARKQGITQQVLHPQQHSQVNGVVAQRTEIFQGPLPSPENLREYELICPGAAERILNLAETQANHRMALEKTAINARIKDSRLGIWFAFILGMTGLIGATWAIVAGHGAAGGVIGSASLGSIVSAFIYGTRTNAKILKQNQE